MITRRFRCYSSRMLKFQHVRVQAFCNTILFLSFSAVACPPSQAMPQQPLQYTIAAPGAVTVTTVTRTGQQQGSVIMAGNCSACGVGVVSENFTLVGLCCAFWLFPIGILCCYTMREKKCTSCGAVFA